MRLKLRCNVPVEKMREFGFAPGSELAEQSSDYAEIFEGCEYMLPWWHKFQLDEDGRPDLTYDGLPVCHAWVDTRDGCNNLWFDVTPCGTYHASMDELSLVTDAVFELTQAGLIEGA